MITGSEIIWSEAYLGSKSEKKQQLFNDELRHSGELVSSIGALLWLQTLYDYDLSKLKEQRVEGLGKIDLNELAQVVSKKIAPFNVKINKD